VSRERKKDPVATWIRVVPIVVLVLAIAAVLGWRWLGRDAAVGAPDPSTGRPEAADAAPPAVETPEEAPATGEAAWPADFDSGGSCGDALASLRDVCATIDALPEARALKSSEGCFEIVTGASERLASRPPVVEGALTSVDAARANIAHLFRVFGERRAFQLARFARTRPDVAEPLALAVYRWIRAGDDCTGDQPRPWNRETQYLYSAFLINTIGGQAYLRRRLPRNEALACFYALLLAERAVAAGHDPLGLDLRPEAERCSQLMESQHGLVFRDRYLESLSRLRGRIGPR
jgi:hypothetical protein